MGYFKANFLSLVDFLLKNVTTYFYYAEKNS